MRRRKLKGHQYDIQLNKELIVCQFLKKKMNESELRSGDSLQSVKYLGKVPSSHAHGIGIAIVSNNLTLFP
jgi:hypothetical protein